MKTAPKSRTALAVYLLKVVFSIYLLITVLITLTQMANEYQRESQKVKRILETTQAIFEPNLTIAAWTFDSNQLEASLNGIQQISAIVGIEIIKMDKPPNWHKPFPIRIGTILNKDHKIVIANKKRRNNNK